MSSTDFVIDLKTRPGLQLTKKFTQKLCDVKKEHSMVFEGTYSDSENNVFSYRMGYKPIVRKYREIRGYWIELELPSYSDLEHQFDGCSKDIQAFGQMYESLSYNIFNKNLMGYINNLANYLGNNGHANYVKDKTYKHLLELVISVMVQKGCYDDEEREFMNRHIDSISNISYFKPRKTFDMPQPLSFKNGQQLANKVLLRKSPEFNKNQKGFLLKLPLKVFTKTHNKDLLLKFSKSTDTDGQNISLQFSKRDILKNGDDIVFRYLRRNRHRSVNG